MGPLLHVLRSRHGVCGIGNGFGSQQTHGGDRQLRVYFVTLESEGDVDKALGWGGVALGVGRR